MKSDDIGMKNDKLSLIVNDFIYNKNINARELLYDNILQHKGLGQQK